MNVWVAGRRKTKDLGKFGNFKKFHEIIEIDDECTVGYLKTDIDNVPEKFQKLAVKHSIEKLDLLYFVNLSTIFFQDCLRKQIFIFNFAQTPWNLYSVAFSVSKDPFTLKIDI